MTEPTTAAATATAASAATAAGVAAAGVVFGAVPPPEVIAWACFGGLCAVWLARKDSTVVITPGWLLSTLMLFVVSVGCGLALSAGLLALAHGGVAGLGWIAYAPHWVLAAAIAGSIHWAGPLLYGVLRTRLGQLQGPAPTQQPGQPPGGQAP